MGLEEMKTEQKVAKEERNVLMDKLNQMEKNYEVEEDFDGEKDEESEIFFHNSPDRLDDEENMQLGHRYQSEEGEAEEKENDGQLLDENSDFDVDDEFGLDDIYKQYEEDKETSGKVDSKLAEFIDRRFMTGLSEESYKKMLDNHKPLRPENCKNLVGVKTNTAVWRAINKGARNRDFKLQNIDRSIVRGAIWLTEAVNELIELQKSLKNDKVNKIIGKCNLSLNMNAHTHHEITMFRREVIKPCLPPKFKDMCSNMMPYTDELFGQDMSKVVNDLEAQHKIRQKMTSHNSRRGFGRTFRAGMRGRTFSQNQNYSGYQANPYHPYGYNESYYGNENYRSKNGPLRNKRRPNRRMQRSK